MPSPRPAVVVVARSIIPAEIHGQPRILFIRRSSGDSHNPGKLEVPGGKLERGEALDEAFVNETEQETGLRVRIKARISAWESHVLTKGPYSGMTYLVNFSPVEWVAGNLVLSLEHDNACLLSIDQALGRNDLTPETYRAIRDFGHLAINLSRQTTISTASLL